MKTIDEKETPTPTGEYSQGNNKASIEVQAEALRNLAPAEESDEPGLPFERPVEKLRRFTPEEGSPATQLGWGFVLTRCQPK